MNPLKKLAMNFFTLPLENKVIFWSRRVRVFTDGGTSRWYWIPKFRKANYSKHWGMTGFCIYLLGREIVFSFGVDKKGLYVNLNEDI